MATALTTHTEARVSLMTDDEIDLIKRTICKDASDEELRLFLHQCKRTGLDPLARQIYAIKRWDSDARKLVMSMQTSIDGFRLIAERTGKYAGQLGPFWCGEDGQWVDVWVSSKPPKAAKVGVMRHDFQEPLWGVARFDSYAQTKKDGGFTRMWAQMGDLMIAKCAEALALRRAFPQELSGLYTADEMSQAESGPAPQRQTEPPKVAQKKTVPLYMPNGAVREYGSAAEYFDAFRAEVRHQPEIWSDPQNAAILEKFLAVDPARFQPMIDEIELAIGTPERGGE